jgi:hypothetical protein
MQPQRQFSRLRLVAHIRRLLANVGCASMNSKLFHNPVLKGHGFSHAAKEQEDRGL